MQVYPLITAVLLQVQFENANKWKSLSKQICDALIPQLNRHSLFLDSDEALQMLQKLISHMDPPVVHESLLGLLQTFTPKQSEDFNTSAAMVAYAKIHLLHIMSKMVLFSSHFNFFY